MLKRHKMVFINNQEADLYISELFLLQREEKAWVLRELPSLLEVDRAQFRNDLACKHNLDLYAYEVQTF